MFNFEDEIEGPLKFFLQKYETFFIYLLVRASRPRVQSWDKNSILILFRLEFQKVMIFKHFYTILIWLWKMHCPNQKLLVQAAIALKKKSSIDPMWVKSKRVWEVSICFEETDSNLLLVFLSILQAIFMQMSITKELIMIVQCI